MSRRLSLLTHIVAKFILLLLALITVTHFSSHKAYAAIKVLGCSWEADSMIKCDGGLVPEDPNNPLNTNKKTAYYYFYFSPSLSVQYTLPIFQLTEDNGQTKAEYITVNDDGSKFAQSTDPSNFPNPEQQLTGNEDEKKRLYAKSGDPLNWTNTWTGSVNPDGWYNTRGGYMVCGLFSKPSEKCWIGPNTKGDPVLLSTIDPTGVIDKLNQTIDGSIRSSQQCDEDGGALSFIFCPFLRSTQDAVIKLTGTSEDGTKKGYLIELLTVKPLDNSPTADNSAKNIYKIWEAFRNIAMGLYTLVFILIIFGNGLGFDNYQIKKALPKLAAGSLMTLASFFIVQTLVDLSNALGNAIPSFIGFITQEANVTDFKIDLAGAGQAVGIIFLILFALAALVAVIVGIAGLITRQIIIYILIMVAPLAFVAWVFPNTQNLFKKWWSNLIKVCMMFPIITAMIAFSILFTKTLDSSSSATLKLAATVAPLIALIMIPKTFKWGGDAFLAGASFVAGYATKGTDAIRRRGGGAIGSGADTVRERAVANLADRGNTRLAAVVGGRLPTRRGAHMARQQRGTLLNEEAKMAEAEFSTATRPQIADELAQITGDLIRNPNSVRNQARYRAAHARAIQHRERGAIEASRARLVGSGNMRAINAANTATGPNTGDLMGFAPDLGPITFDAATGAINQFNPSTLSLETLADVHHSFTESLANNPVQFSQIRTDVLDRLSTDPRTHDRFNGNKVQQLGLALDNLQARINAGTATPQMIANHASLTRAIIRDPNTQVGNDPTTIQWRFR